MFISLSPPPRISISIFDAPLNLINRCAPAMSPPMDPFKPGNLQTANLAEIQDSVLETDQRIGLAYLHCEVALAVLMKGRIPGLMEIGVSKDCRWPCTVFLTAYSERENGGADVTVSASHGKTYSNWLFPTEDVQNTSKVLVAVRQQMDDVVRKVFCHWPKSVDDHRRSDSGAEPPEHELTVSEEESENIYMNMLLEQ